MFKLGTACYVIRYVKHVMSQDTLRTIYFSYFHAILLYGIIFWGNSAYSSCIFKIQKRIIRIIMNAKWRFLSSVIKEFKNFTTKIIIYFFPLYYLLQKNRDLYELNSEIHNITIDLVLTYILQLQT
jgi:hypothetical protein